MSSSPLLHGGCPVICLPSLCLSLSCTLTHSPRGKGAGDWKCEKSPDRMLPDSLHSAEQKLSLPGASGNNSARLLQTALCCKCKTEIHLGTSCSPSQGSSIFLPPVPFTKPLLERKLYSAASNASREVAMLVLPCFLCVGILVHILP